MLLAIESIVGFIALFLGAMGLAGFFGPLLQPHVFGVLAVGVFLLPFLLLFVVMFPARPMLSASSFRRVWLFAACWHGLLAVAAEICYARGYMPPESPEYARTLLRAMLHVGWLGFVPVVHAYIISFRSHPRAPNHALQRTEAGGRLCSAFDA